MLAHMGLKDSTMTIASSWSTYVLVTAGKSDDWEEYRVEFQFWSDNMIPPKPSMKLATISQAQIMHVINGPTNLTHLLNKRHADIHPWPFEPSMTYLSQPFVMISSDKSVCSLLHLVSSHFKPYFPLNFAFFSYSDHGLHSFWHHRILRASSISLKELRVWITQFIHLLNGLNDLFNLWVG